MSIISIVIAKQNNICKAIAMHMVKISPKVYLLFMNNIERNRMINTLSNEDRKIQKRYDLSNKKKETNQTQNLPNKNKSSIDLILKYSQENCLDIVKYNHGYRIENILDVHKRSQSIHILKSNEWFRNFKDEEERLYKFLEIIDNRK